MAPSRRRKDVGQPLQGRQTALSRVLGNSNIFMGQDRERIEGVEIIDQTIDGTIRAIFFGKGAQHAVPNDQNPRIVGVEIARIIAVMDPMVRRGVEDELIPTRHAIDRLGMEEELIGGIEHAAEGDHHRVETDQHQRNLQQHGAGKMLGPGLTKRDGEVVVLARMMNHMHGPDPAAAMGDAVMGIEAQIIEHETERKHGPGQRQFLDLIGLHKGQYAEGDDR